MYLGGVLQYFKNRILSVQYILMKMRRPAKYKNGMAKLYSMIMKMVAMIELYLSASSMYGPVYRSSYRYWSTWLVLFSLQLMKLRSLHLLSSARNQNAKLLRGIIVLKKQVRQMVEPTAEYQSIPKSL